MKRKTDIPILDKDPDYISPRDNSELVTLLKELQKRFVVSSDMHNKLEHAIRLAKQ
jgi:hypothetical protein